MNQQQAKYFQQLSYVMIALAILNSFAEDKTGAYWFGTCYMFFDLKAHLYRNQDK